MLYLASTSARRHQLLRDAGIPYVEASPGPEPRFSGEPLAVARLRAESKACGARVDGEAGWILGVDTVVDLDGLELGKAADVDAARKTLSSLSGRTHLVHTALHLVSHPGGRILAGAASARVRCEELSAARIEAFLATGTWRGKAGAYGLQDPECDFMVLEQGQADTVIGLPVAELRRLLEAAGEPE